MARCWFVLFCALAWVCPVATEAQDRRVFMTRPIYQHPFPSSGYGSGYNGYGSAASHRSHYHSGGYPYVFGIYIVQPPPVVSYQYPVYYPTSVTPLNYDTVKPIKAPSSPAARLKSLNHQARGDQRLREQKWSDAKVAYLSAVSTAPDRAEGHLRLGLCYVVIQRFDSAVREFKRALAIDPSISRSAEKMGVLFGPDSQIVRTSIVSKLGDWVREDLQSSDRLFLFGVILDLNDDPQARDVLQAAIKSQPNGDNDHIQNFMNPKPPAEPDEPRDIVPAVPNPGLPKLNDKPAGEKPAAAKPAGIRLAAKQISDLRFPAAPTPMPDGFVRPEVAAPVPMP